MSKHHQSRIQNDPLEAAKQGAQRGAAAPFALTAQTLTAQSALPLEEEVQETSTPVTAPVPLPFPSPTNVKKIKVLRDFSISNGAAMVRLVAGRIVASNTHPELFARILRDKGKLPVEEVN